MVLRQKMEHMGRKAIDVLDNLQGIPTQHFELPHTPSLTESLLPPQSLDQLAILGEQMAIGEKRIIEDIVGEGTTQHPHRFVVERHADGIRIKFIDPEYTVGARNALRPYVVNLMAAHLPADNTSPTLHIFRYATRKTNRREASDSLHLHESLLDGLVAGEKELPEYAIPLFSLTLQDGQMELTARLTSPGDAQRFARGEQGSHVLEGKKYAQQAIVNRFAEFSKAGSFIQSKKPNILRR